MEGLWKSTALYMPAKTESAGLGSHRLQQLPHAPDVIGDLGFHHRSDAKRLVNSAKVVEHEPHDYSGPMVLPLLAEGVREPGEPPKAHARAQIAALDNGWYRCARDQPVLIHRPGLCS